MTGYSKIWPLFGAANQLLAALALLTVCAWLGNIGRNNKMFYIPMIFMGGACQHGGAGAAGWSKPAQKLLHDRLGKAIARSQHTEDIYHKLGRRQFRFRW